VASAASPDVLHRSSAFWRVARSRILDLAQQNLPVSTRVDNPILSMYVDEITEATDLARETTSADPAVGLRAVASLRILLESLEELQVENARREGWSWQAIAS